MGKDNVYKCPFCEVTIPIVGATHSWIQVFFDKDKGLLPYESLNSTSNSPMLYEPIRYKDDSESLLGIEMIKCPSCDNIILLANGIGEKFHDKTFMIQPRSTHETYPDYVPEYIRSCYEQACDVLELSPMASGTLSRKTLEGIIDDVFADEINNSNQRKDRLFDKINIIEKIYPNSKLIKTFHSLRQTGNITAHFKMDKNQMPEDVDHYEAKALIEFIELTIRKTYIENHYDSQVINKMNKIADDKKNQ